MTKKEEILKKWIINYEDEKVSLEETLEKINEISNSPIDQYILENYWTSEDLDEFVRRYAIEDIHDWKDINDTQANSLNRRNQGQYW